MNYQTGVEDVKISLVDVYRFINLIFVRQETTLYIKNKSIVDEEQTRFSYKQSILKVRNKQLISEMCVRKNFFIFISKTES